MLKIIIILLLILACTPAPRYKTEYQKSSSSKSTNKSNVKFIPVTKAPTLEEFDTSQKIYRGLSSYYGKDFHGKLTANGEVFDMYGITAAHKTIPLNTVARVTNLVNNKSLILRINDRGPYVEDRILDCSYGAAKKLDFINTGTTEVEIEVIEWGDNVYMHH